MSEGAKGAKRVWLAEDDDELREMVAFVLRKIGLDVLELTTGDQILRAAEKDPLPDLLVTDHHMPGTHGLDAVETLRARDLSMPVVLVTAFADANVRARASKLGIVLLEKPCDLYELRRAVLDQLRT